MTYPEVCADCGHQFTHVRTSNRCDAHPRCPACGGPCKRDWAPEANRGAFGLIFRGEGFYANRARTVVTPAREGAPREVDLQPGQRSAKGI